MSENKPFIVTDRRKFNVDGSSRPDADPSPERETSHAAPAEPETPVADGSDLVESHAPSEQAFAPELADDDTLPEADTAEDVGDEPTEEELAAANAPEGAEGGLPPAPTEEQMEQSRLAFQSTSDRLDTALRAANPGMEHPPAMSFDRVVQSIYMTAVMQMGGGTPEGQQPQIDLLGARQSIEMLGIIADKADGNLTDNEQRLLDGALFELRLGFLEMTQALARQAAARQQPGAPGGFGGPGGPGAPGGPRIVR